MTYLKSTALGAALTLTALAAQAETFRIADFVPANHYLMSEGMDAWMAEIAERTDGKVSFQHFPAQQLGKAPDILRLVQAGVADVGHIGVSMPGDAMSLSDVAQLPGVYDGACKAADALLELGQNGNILDAADYAGNNLHLLYAVILPPAQIYSSAKPIGSIADIKGMKIGTTLRGAQTMLDALGAAPVMLSSGPEGYEAFTRGTVDGMVWGAQAMYSYDMADTAKFGTRNAVFTPQHTTVFMNLDAWNALDAETQAIVNEVSKQTQDHLCQYLEDSELSYVSQLADQDGVKLTVLPDEELAKMADISKIVSQRWAAGVDNRGKPGSEILAAFRDKIGLTD